MLLAVDIGNTNVTLGLFRMGREPSRAGRSRLSLSSAAPAAEVSWRLQSSLDMTADEYGTKILDLLHYAMIERSAVKTVAVASVVPHLTSVFAEVSQKYFRLKAAVVGENLKIDMPNLYDNPREVGADRIVNAVAAYARCGGPCVVVDFGTATTFDCVTKKGEYAGGIIVPGPNLAAASLALHTAKLPKVEISKPGRVIGKNTVESIQSGLYYGYISLVDGILDRLEDEMGFGSRVLSTGGLASLIAGESRFVKKDAIFPLLTLEGIYRLWERQV